MTQKESGIPATGTDSDLLRTDFRGARFLIIPGHFDYMGGAERQSVLLARELIQTHECHVDFLGWGGDGVLADEVRSVGARPIVFPLDDQQRGLKRIQTLFQLARFIKQEIKPDYLLPFVGYHCKVIGSIWRRTGARFTWWNQRDEGRLIFGTPREHRLLATLPAVVSNSFEGRDFLVQKFKLNPDRIRVINNGVEIPEELDRSHWREKLKLTDESVLIGMIANLTEYKDHVTLLKAFSEVRKSPVGERCHLVLAGRHDGTTQLLKALAFDLGLCKSVSMIGSISDTSALLAATDLVVHSSMKEGCPNGALEAMACGRCVLGTDISGMRQALGEDAASRMLAPAGDSQRLADLMVKMIESPELRKEAGESNRQRIQSEFGVERMAREVLETVLEHRIQ